MRDTSEPNATLELAANVSIMFAELPYLERFAAAAAAGFQSVETWWPFVAAVPSRAEVDLFLDTISRAAISLSAINLFGGDLTAGERGVTCRLDRREEFDANLELVAMIAERTGCRGFNALYGQRWHAQSAAEQDALALRNYSAAVERLGPLGGTVFVEPLTRGKTGNYPIEMAWHAAAMVERVRELTGSDAIGILFDTYHLANNGENLAQAILDLEELTAHVQIADTPGRGQPGSGGLPIPALVEQLWISGYRRAIACEYQPTGRTTDSFAWMDVVPRIALNSTGSA